MKKWACLLLVGLSIVAVSGKPRSRSEYGNVTDVYSTGGSYENQDECGAAIMRERCSGIMINALSAEGNALRTGIQHYCRTIPPYVPCLEENRADYLVLLGCPDIIMMHMSQWMTSVDLTTDDVFDISVNFIDTVNDVLCSRIDEVLDLVKCVEKKGRQVGPDIEVCFLDHMSPLMNMIHHDVPFEQDRSEFCGSLYGLGQCVRDTLVTVCEDSTDLLDTAMDDVIDGVIGNGLGCEASTNSLLSFVRSVRDKLRR